MKARKKVYLQSKMRSKVHRRNPIDTALFLLVLFVLAGGLLFHGRGCIDVFRYTIPAGAAVSDRFPSIIGYLKGVGLFQHITSMPLSAQTYLLRNVFGAAGCLAIMIFSFFVFGKSKSDSSNKVEVEATDQEHLDTRP